MRDGFGREISYLRLSITERCQLRCEYCRASEGKCPKKEEMTRAQLYNIALASSKLGINKLRLTGGEPLIRKDVVDIAADLCAISGVDSVNLTTNGQLLSDAAADLKRAGVKGLNISLDTLKPDLFFKLTGGSISRTLAGLYAALSAGFQKVKINVVLEKGRNDGEVDAFFSLAKELPVDVRFIELMPLSSESIMSERFVSSDSIIAAHPELVPVTTEPFAPARLFKIDGSRGQIGFISAVSHPFCERCNRIRVTSAGTLRPCLGQNDEFLLADAANDVDELQKRIASGINNKPVGHAFGCGFAANADMRSIGG